MKLICILLLVPFLSFSQIKYDELYPVTYDDKGFAQITGVVMVDSLSADAIYDKIDLWFAKTFVDSRSVIETKNKDSHFFYGNGFHISPYTYYIVKYKAGWSYNLEIKTKDGKFKYIINNIRFDKIDMGEGFFSDKKPDFYHQKSSNGNKLTSSAIPDKKWNEIKLDVKNSLQYTAHSLHQLFINKDNDW
jgi:hypothetical protein